MTDTEQPGATIPPCDICGHRFHGLPCTVGIGQRVTWGGQPELETCKCLGVWADAREVRTA